MALGSGRGTGVFPSAVKLVLVFWETLDFSTLLGNLPGFLGLGVCFGVEQGARINY